MDIPGLNDNFVFYFKKIIPIIANKCLFSIYIFDLLKYEDIDTLKIYNEYSKQLNKFYNTNSIYILNKIDEIKEEDIKNNKDVDYHFKNFKKYLSGTDEKEKYKNDDIKEEAKEIHEKDENKKDDKDENKKEEKEKNEKCNVNLKENFFIPLSSSELFNKVNAFSNLKIYILHIIDEIKNEKEKDSFHFLEHLKKKFIEYFYINKEELEEIFNDKDDNKYKNYFDETEFEEICQNIIKEGFILEFEEEHYNKFKFIFNNKEKINLPIKELNDVYDTILNSIKKSMDKFFNWDNVKKLFTKFDEFIDKSFEKEEQKKIYKDICNKLLNSFNKELERKKKLEKIEWNIKILNPLKTIIDSLIKLDPIDKSLKRLKEDFDSLSYFIYNNRKIRITLLGGYSTGKSSFLNNLIGKDILPVDINRCTNRGIIIRHNKKINTPQLFKTKFTCVKNPEYWYFKDEEDPICEGYENIKKKIN